MAISVSIRVFHDIGDTPSDNSAAQAGCSATCISYYSGTKTYTGGHPRPGESGGTTNVAFTNYQLTATPATASGWTFKGWDVLYNDYVTGGLDAQGNVRTDVEIVAGRQYQSGPSPYPSSTSAVDFQFPYDFEEANPGWDWTRHTFRREIIAIYAQFEQGTPPPPTYTITTAVSPSGAGTTTGDGTYNSGASCTITATPAAGYIFVRWEKNGAQVSTNASYTFTVNESATYTAVFEEVGPIYHTVTVSAFPEGWGTASGGGSYLKGSQCTVTATPNEGYLFARWTNEYGTTITTAQEYTFTVQRDETLRAVFTDNLATLTVSCSPSVIDTTWISAGEEQSSINLTISVVAGSYVRVTAWSTSDFFRFREWTGDETGDSYSTMIHVTRNMEITANFDALCQVEAHAMPTGSPHGTVKVGSAASGDTSALYVRCGDSVSVVATPNSGYVFLNWSDDGASTHTVVTPTTFFSTIVLYAYFRALTNLLVNSFNRSTPVQLVYDPATNLLVADY